MTDTAVTAARQSWLSHPILAWRTYQAALAERADAEAAAAGLTVEVLPNGLRRYRDPRLDQLAAHRAARGAASPYPGIRHGQCAGGAVAWSTPTLVLARAHAPDIGTLSAGPAGPVTGMTDRRTERGGLHMLAGAGAVPDPPLPHQAGCARSFPDGSAEKRDAGKHLPVRLDPGDPAGPVPGAPRAGAQNNAPARPRSGPANTAGGAR
jgi:hypothetical protein